MEQLEMFRMGSNLPRPKPCPEGVSLSLYGGERDINGWIDCCRDGLIDPAIRPEQGRAVFRDCIENYRDLNPEKDVFFAKVGNDTAATVTAVFHPENREGYIHMVATKPQYRGKGIGGWLLAIAIKKLCLQECRFISLTTDDFRLPAIMSYLKTDFYPVNSSADAEARWLAVLQKLNMTCVPFLNPDGTTLKILNVTKEKEENGDC